MKYNFSKTRFLFVLILCALSFSAGAARAQTTMTITPCGSAPDYTSSPNTYAGLYKNPESLFHHPQFPDLSPSDLQVTQNNLPVAPGIQPCPTAPWKDPVTTYAAYMFCGLNAQKPRNPLYDVPGILPGAAATGNINMTGAQLYAFEDYEQISAAATVVYSHCMNMVQRRLSYGPHFSFSATFGLDNASGCTQGDMYCQQKTVCQILKSPMNGAVNAGSMAQSDNTALAATSATGSASGSIPPGNANSTSGDSGSSSTSGDSGSSSSATSSPNFGHAITNTNNPDLDGILASCDGNDSDTYAGGLSQEAHDAIWAHRCDDPNYTGALASAHGGGKDGEVAVEKCHDEAKAYDKEVRDDIVKLEAEVLSLKTLTANLASQSKGVSTPTR